MLHGIVSSLRWFFVVVAVFTASGCGGGGGGGASDPGTPATGTGLIPTAPAIGATLYADATTLQPLRPAAVWHYRGSGTGMPAYGVLVQHTAASAGGVTARRQSTANNDNASATYVVAGTDINAAEIIDFTAGATPTSYTYALLRSPVRQSDQITLLDRSAVATGLDIDGDSVADSADIAGYSRVAGNESVELPDLQKSIVALRVDTTYLVRFKRSSNGQVDPPISLLQSDWYAPGIGLIRHTTATPAIGSSAAGSTDETLIFWDGVSEGVGALPAVRLRQADNSFPLVQLWSAVRLGDRAMVASLPFGSPSAGGILLSAVDLRGAVMSTRAYPDMPDSASRGSLLPLVDSVALVDAEPSTSGSPYVSFEIRLRRFDNNGAVIGPASGLILVDHLSVDAVTAASDGQKIWVAWIASSSIDNGINTLMLAAFDGNGQVVVAPQVLDSASFLGSPVITFTQIAIGASPGRVLASWGVSDPAGALNMKYALMLGSAAPQLRTLGLASGSGSDKVVPIVSDSRQSLAWNGVLGFGGFSNIDDQLMRAVALGDDGALLPTHGASLDAQVLDARPGSVAATGPSTGASTLQQALAFADGSSFRVGVVRNDRMIPALDNFSLAYLQLEAWPAASALADTPPTVQRRRLEYASFANATGFDGLRFVVPFDDRLLAVGAGISTPASIAVVFRR